MTEEYVLRHASPTEMDVLNVDPTTQSSTEYKLLRHGSYTSLTTPSTDRVEKDTLSPPSRHRESLTAVSPPGPLFLSDKGKDLCSSNSCINLTENAYKLIAYIKAMKLNNRVVCLLGFTTLFFIITEFFFANVTFPVRIPCFSRK